MMGIEDLREATEGASGACGHRIARDDIRKQGWWIWADDPWQTYRAVPEGFQITNGAFTFNRVIHGPSGPCQVLAGDRPQVKLAQTPSWQYGDLSLAVVTDAHARWCHDFDHIVATYDPGRMLYTLCDSDFPGLTLHAEVLPLANTPGFIARVHASQPVDLLWAYGGLKFKGRSVLAQGPMPGGVRPDDLVGDQAELGVDCVRVTHPDLPLGACVGTQPSGQIHLGDAEDGTKPYRIMTRQPGKALLAIGRVPLDGEPLYIVACLSDVATGFWTLRRLLISAQETYEAASRRCQAIQDHLKVKTPNLLFDQAARGIASSLHGCWLPPSYLHGAVRWGMEAQGWLTGWRGWYGPIALGWYERVVQAARLHAQNQVEERQTAHSGPGRIRATVGFDGRVDYTEEYNMGEVYLDHVYSYYCWTGDRDLLRELYPTIRDHLAWERRTLDPDDDGLYENHMNTWISDGHWYCGGAGAQSSAYMYQAHLLAAEAAALADDDAEPYLAHAQQIKEALNRDLWLPDRDHYAEYREYMEPHRIHDAAELATIYHPIDSQIPDMFQTYQCLRYVENRLWLPNDLLLANDWYPVIVTNGTIATSEILHTALCYYRLGDVDHGWRLMRSIMANFVKARVPGTITEYAGENCQQGTYVDFTDSSSMYARVVVEGVFGIMPRRQDSWLVIQLGLPRAWSHAEIQLRDIAYAYRRDDLRDLFSIRTSDRIRKRLRLGAREDQVAAVTFNGEPVPWEVEPGVGRSFIVIETPPVEEVEIVVTYRPALHQVTYDPIITSGDRTRIQTRGCAIDGMYDPQTVLSKIESEVDQVTGEVSASPGRHTFFIKLSHRNTASWPPIDVEVRAPVDVIAPKLLISRDGKAKARYAFTLRNNRPRSQRLTLRAMVSGQMDGATVEVKSHSEIALSFALVDPSRLTPGVTPLTVEVTGDWQGALTNELRVWRLFEELPDGRQAFRSRCLPVELPFNDRLEAVFTHEYTAPRPPGWALQIDAHALNAWTGTWYPPECINADHLRANMSDQGTSISDIGVPFHQVSDGPNGLFISRWDRFPERVSIPIGHAAREMYLLIAGSSLNNQTYIANGRLVVTYTDDERQTIDLVNPTSYDHLLQHFSENYPQWIGGDKDGYYIVGGGKGTRADIVNVPLNGKEVRRLEVECIAPEIIIGMMGLTLVM